MDMLHHMVILISQNKISPFQLFSQQKVHYNLGQITIDMSHILIQVNVIIIILQIQKLFTVIAPLFTLCIDSRL